MQKMNYASSIKEENNYKAKDCKKGRAEQFNITPCSVSNSTGENPNE